MSLGIFLEMHEPARDCAYEGMPRAVFGPGIKKAVSFSLTT